MDQVKIGKFIATCRKEKHLTQEQLAEKLNISTNAVSKWERGICLMDIRLLKPLSEILEVSANEILSGERISEEQYKQKAEDNFMLLSQLNLYKHLFKGTIVLLLTIAFLMFYSLMIGLESSGYAALLFGFSSLTYYVKYNICKDNTLLIYCALMLISFTFCMINFIFSTL